MICECHLCHRLRIDGEWTVRVGVVAQVMGICPTCLGWQERVAAAKWAQAGRQLLRDRERGYGGPAEGEDVFRGFREGQ